jgi:tripartite-type tricarboxylate transporter receptor subunit TctC
MPSVLVSSVLAILAASIAGAQAQSVEDFYRGKTIDVVIGFGAGGGNDTYARLLANHIGKHIPGRPNLIPKNMPGAGSFLAVNNVFNIPRETGLS